MAASEGAREGQKGTEGVRHRRRPQLRKVAAAQEGGSLLAMSSSWTGTSRGKRLLYGAVVAAVVAVSAFYGVLVVDIAREYALTTPPTDPHAFHIGNLWESFFTAATTEELGVGVHGISRQRKVYSDSWMSVVSHWVGGGILMFVGPFQFIDTLRDRFPALHRASGYLYYAGAALSLVGSLTLYVFHPMKTEMYGGYIFSLPLFLLALVSLRANIEAIRSVLREKRSIRRHMGYNALGFATFLTAPWLRLLWISFPRISRWLGMAEADYDNMEIINLVSEPWVLTPMVIFALLFLSGQNLFASSPRLRLWKLSSKTRNLLLLWALLTFAAVFYQLHYRFRDGSNFLYATFRVATAADLAEEYSASKMAFFDGFSQAPGASANPLLAGLLASGLPAMPLAYTFVYLASLLVTLVLGPYILHQTTHRGRSGTITSLVYTLALLGQTLALAVLETLADGRAFGGCVQTSIAFCQLCCWWFCWLMLVYFGFLRGDPRLSRAWAVFTVAAGQGSLLFQAVLVPLLAWGLDHDFYSAYVTAGMLASSIPYIESYSFVNRPGVP